MLVSRLVLLAIAFIAFWLGLHDRDEVHQIALFFTGSIVLVWLFAIMPNPIQLAIAFLTTFLFFGFKRLQL
jgi:Na+-transporting NADH:ubiquinone oxidoreductase subunit NqrB